MFGLLLVAAAGATGYVLGSKAGRERYDEIVAKTTEIVGDDNMAKMRSASQTVGDRTRQFVADAKAKKAHEA